MQQQDGLGFVEAQKAESQEIAASRARRRKDAPAEPGDDLVGLAFSGGGIRSATFNLGVVQALAARDLLRCVDYLSTEQSQFPHQSTGDQWFDEAQFESYRALGRQAGDRVVADVAEALREPQSGVPRLQAIAITASA